MSAVSTPETDRGSSRTEDGWFNQAVTKLIKRVFDRVKKTWKIPLPDEPDYEIHMLKEDPRIREIALDEEDRLMKASLNSGYDELIQFMLASGLRKADALIRWEQVDECARRIHVTQKAGTTA